jgi:hypothetical protein
MLILLEAYPSWSTRLVNKTEKRLKKTLGDIEFDSLQRRIRSAARSSIATAASNTGVARRGSLLEGSYEPDKPEISIKNTIWLEIVHLILIVYTSFSITLELAFQIKIEGGLLAMELLCCVESCCYMFARFRQIYRQMKLNKVYSCWAMVKHYYTNCGLLPDLLAVSPFNLAFGAVGMTTPLFAIVPLGMLRVLSMFKVPDLLNKIEFELIQLSKYITLAKTAYFLIYLWHFNSCLWFFINTQVESEDTFKWYNYNNLEGETLAN